MARVASVAVVGLVASGCGSRSALPAPAPPCDVYDAAGPALAAGASGIGAITCATEATPVLTFASPGWAMACGTSPDCGFTPDTGLRGAMDGLVGTSYGQPSCPDQFLIEAGLEGQKQRSVVATGGWSIGAYDVSPNVCAGYAATMTLWGFDGSWSQFDQVVYEGQFMTLAGSADGGTTTTPDCVTSVVSAQQGEGNAATPVPTDRFTKFRVAIVATSCGRLLPIDLSVLSLR
jgi:hypothetical protein